MRKPSLTIAIISLTLLSLLVTVAGLTPALFAQSDTDGPLTDGDTENGLQSSSPHSSKSSGAGRIALYLHQKFYRGAGHAFSPSSPGGVTIDYKAKFHKNNPGEYIINYGEKKTILWNLQRDTARVIPHIGEWGGTEAFLNGLSLGYKHGYIKSFPVTARAAGKITTDWAYNRWTSGKFFFLPDGKHLFVDTPGMGQNESSFFIDKIIGQNQTLYYVPTYPGKPVSLLIKDAFQRATLVDNGKAIVYFRMEKVSADEERRTLVVEAVAVATHNITLIARFDAEAKGATDSGQSHYFRGVPGSYFCTTAPVVLFQKSMVPTSAWYCGDTRSGQVVPLPGGDGWILIPPLGERTLFSAHALLGRVVAGRVELKALSLPDMRVIYSSSFVPQGVVKYLNESVCRGDYLP